MTPIDPARLARALSLRVELLGADSALVSGGARSHVVDRDGCDCEDAAFNPGVHCKHVLARHLVSRLDPRVLTALRELAADRAPAGVP